jgi:formylglycine-generating enzyme required for sulfatase activity
MFVYATASEIVGQTATATLWTDTPTPDITASIYAFQTQRANDSTATHVAGQTATAESWTDTPTATNTPSDTPTTTYTPSRTPTATSTATPTPIPLGFPGNPVTRNADWTPVIQDFDGVEMVLVPVGCFMMGSDDGDEDEQPVHQQCFDEPFWIDQTEVTNRQFGSEGYYSGDNRPRDSMSWSDAHDFCASRGARLPTEAEWEYAARGPDGLVYPWGNEFVSNNVVHHENARNETAEVGSRPGGISWVGAFDLSGNVWEWLSTVWDPAEFPYPYNPNDGREVLDLTYDQRVLRGGAWDDNELDVRATNRSFAHSVGGFPNEGFRCARSVSPLGEPGNPVTSNADWTPVIQPYNGVPMALVPAGCFTMGSEDGDDDEIPVQQQCFDEPFWIDVYEVTNAQFETFGGEAQIDSRWTDPNRPRERINWFEAYNFCSLRGARLPTEAEWEYAARGPDNLVYPWNNEFSPDHVVYYGNSDDQTTDVGSRPNGVSWVGAHDMSGNVLEWVSTAYDNLDETGEFPYPYDPSDGREDAQRTDVYRVLRGGSFHDSGRNLDAANRSRNYLYIADHFGGFRCARSESP